ncbi:hypothetical protein [Candidatus Bathycorpusculum sp.]|uniref:hypothetical protein n=1 Tax=Candidatus Bathycorpusculum sp. TaxID=2994959 RepID=UPI0028250C9B|nr:hypothetical protein [Candidatus Termitimicrobium sp.]
MEKEIKKLAKVAAAAVPLVLGACDGKNSPTGPTEQPLSVFERARIDLHDKYVGLGSLCEGGAMANRNTLCVKSGLNLHRIRGCDNNNITGDCNLTLAESEERYKLNLGLKKRVVLDGQEYEMR